MNVQIGVHEFDNVYYDRSADVLYMSKGKPAAAEASRETPEGHVVRMDGDGAVIGITLIGPRGLLARHGRIVVTLPDAVEPDPDAIVAAMTGPA